jgi:2'-5' RNA ligase
MARPNWFFGFPVDGSFVLDLPDLPHAFRRFHPADVHVTLAFLGSCTESASARALDALDRQLEIAPPRAVDVSLGRVVPMGGSQRAYTALSALLDRGAHAVATTITSLRNDLTEAAAGRREARPVKPHLTIARPRRRASNTDREAGLAWAAGLDLGSVEARLDRIALYTWSEMRNVRLFRIVAERRLR